MTDTLTQQWQDANPDATVVPLPTGYNGWANYETWNASLWINNDESMYRLAVSYVEQARRFGQKVRYDNLIPALEYNFGQMTPDGTRWMDGRIDTAEMDEMLEEIA